MTHKERALWSATSACRRASQQNALSCGDSSKEECGVAISAIRVRFPVTAPAACRWEYIGKFALVRTGFNSPNAPLHGGARSHHSWRPHQKRRMPRGLHNWLSTSCRKATRLRTLVAACSLFSGCSSAWQESSVRIRVVAGSNPATQTKVRRSRTVRARLALSNWRFVMKKKRRI